MSCITPAAAAERGIVITGYAAAAASITKHPSLTAIISSCQMLQKSQLAVTYNTSTSSILALATLSMDVIVVSKYAP